MLDDHLLNEFMQGFHGYGCYEAPWWFVGMEEAGGNDEAQIAGRLSAWARRGRLQLEDVAEFHREFGVTKFWRDNPPTQPTWRKLIRLKLAASLCQGVEVTMKQIREFQRDHWGRKGSKTCLLELLPLPSPDADDWRYNSWTQIAQLQDRTSYVEWMAPTRIEVIRKKLDQHRPKVVVFYGLGYRMYWEEIADVKFIKNEQNCSYLGRSDWTSFLISPHPIAQRKNSYWDQVGKSILQ